jgi:hypothetical protein
VPPRHTYWTIILEGKPTAFRAHTQEELLPTLRQLQSRHPDAVLRWFARGRLWESPEEERVALAARRAAKREPRDREWRPGGAHRDPRDRFKVPREEKRQRFRDRLYRDRSESDKPRSDASVRREGKPPHPRAPGRPLGPAGSKRGWNRGGPPGAGRGGRKPGGGRKGGGGGGRGGGAR